MVAKFVAKILLKRVFRMAVAGLIVRALARPRLRLLALATLFTVPESVRACSVCFGDPESPMMKGAAAGVYVMVGVVAFVLTGIAGTACFWLVRARRLTTNLPRTSS